MQVTPTVFFLFFIIFFFYSVLYSGEVYDFRPSSLVSCAKEILTSYINQSWYANQ